MILTLAAAVADILTAIPQLAKQPHQNTQMVTLTCLQRLVATSCLADGEQVHTKLGATVHVAMHGHRRCEQEVRGNLHMPSRHSRHALCRLHLRYTGFRAQQPSFPENSNHKTPQRHNLHMPFSGCTCATKASGPNNQAYLETAITKPCRQNLLALCRLHLCYQGFRPQKQAYLVTAIT